MLPGPEYYVVAVNPEAAAKWKELMMLINEMFNGVSIDPFHEQAISHSPNSNDPMDTWKLYSCIEHHYKNTGIERGKQNICPPNIAI